MRTFKIEDYGTLAETYYAAWQYAMQTNGNIIPVYVTNTNVIMRYIVL